MVKSLISPFPASSITVTFLILQWGLAHTNFSSVALQKPSLVDVLGSLEIELGVLWAVGILDSLVDYRSSILPSAILGEGALLVAAGLVARDDADLLGLLEAPGLVVLVCFHDQEVGCYRLDEE